MQELDLPELSAAEIAHSDTLCELIKKEISLSNSWISFDRYMQLALYEPSLGYYASGSQKFGEQGDFITSPEVGPLFAQTLAQPIAQLLNKMVDAVIIEFGAGSGKLAADLLQALSSINKLPEKYYIVELSAELQQRQKLTIQQKNPLLINHVEWLSELPNTKINAVVLANEVLDAMPVKRFKLHENKVYELGVETNDQQLKLSYRIADEQLTEQVKRLEIESIGQTEYCSEINLNIKPWLKAVADSLNQAAIYLIDYGYPRSEYYAEERCMGTFIGYYRHRSMDAPLWYPGLQDLTAFVDFTEVAEAALEAGLDVDGFTSQGNFLINCNITGVLERTETKTEIEHLQLVQQMKTISLPGEMGERFKVIGLSKGLDENVPGFEVRDFRYRL